MAARKPRKDDITVVGMMTMEDGSIVPWGDLTPEQTERFYERSAKRLSVSMSDYYSQHPDEYRRLKSLE